MYHEQSIRPTVTQWTNIKLNLLGEFFADSLYLDCAIFLVNNSAIYGLKMLKSNQKMFYIFAL